MASLNFDALNEDSKSQLACTLASLILSDSKKNITTDEINKILKSANLSVAAHWPILFANAISGKNVCDLLCGSSNNASSDVVVPTAQTASLKDAGKKEVPAEKAAVVEEVDVDMDMGDLFG